MPRITNYGELKTAVAERLHRSDLAGQMDETVQIVEDQVMLRLQAWQITIQLALTDADRRSTDSPSYFLPFDFWQLVDIYTVDPANFDQIDPATSTRPTPLDQRQLLNELRKGSRVPANGYSISPDATYLNFSQVPPAGTSYLMYYYEGLTPLVADTDFTFLLRFSPQVYLYGMCKELAIYIQDMELAEVYNQLFETAVDKATEQSRRMVNKGPVQVEGASQWV